MFDSSFRAEALKKEVQRYDRRIHDSISDPERLEAVLNLAASVCESGFAHASLVQHTIKGKPVYQLGEFHYELVLRKLNRNIRVATRVKQADRNTTIRRVRSLLSEGVPHRVYKLDIKSFYESISTDIAWDLLHKDKRITRQSAHIANSFLRHCELQGVDGVPRGVGLSSTIAELLMRDFDEYARMLPEVYFYSRYVDDILLITSTFENPSEFVAGLQKRLPEGLVFNSEKEKVVPLDRRPTAANPAIAGWFDYLGYRVEISHPTRDADNKIFRTVKLDLADKKVKRLKTRLVKSLLRYTHDGNFDDLAGR